MIDTHTDWNPRNPINQEQEPKSYFSELEMYQDKLENQIKATLYYKEQLKRLAEIESDKITFGSITYEQQIEKQNILKNYL